MKKRFLGALILVLLFLIPSPGIAGTRIDLFDVTVEVQRDGTMEVTERIEVTEEGGGSSGGVLRSFITGRPDTHGQIVDTEFTVLSAAVDGSEMPARAERAGRMVSVDLGRPEPLSRRGSTSTNWSIGRRGSSRSTRRTTTMSSGM